ncbi:MAG: hypothetical protein ACOYYS_28345 [Chloroflexota bacterium]
MSTYKNQAVKLPQLPISRNMVVGGLIFMALIAFEAFNYSSTEFSLSDLIGDLKFMGIRWATILAIAFCGIDFAGIARLFTPEKGKDEPAEVWYLFGAWLLAAGMNAILTWWGVSVAIVNHQTSGGAVVAQQTLVKIVPVFVAIMVWVIRILIIGTFSVAGEHLMWQDARPNTRHSPYATNHTGASTATAYGGYKPQQRPLQPAGRSMSGPTRQHYNPAPKPQIQNDYNAGYSRPEPTYHDVAATARTPRPGSQVRR